MLERGAALCVGVVDDALYAQAAELAATAGATCQRVGAGAGEGFSSPPPIYATTQRSLSGSPSSGSRRGSSIASA